MKRSAEEFKHDIDELCKRSQDLRSESRQLVEELKKKAAESERLHNRRKRERRRKPRES